MASSVQTRFRIDGMDCAGCATKIDSAVRRMPGVTEVTVSVAAETMTVRHQGTIDLDASKTKVTALG